LEVKRLTAAEVHEIKMADLGLDPTALDLASQEAIAAALRRAAGFLCPCSASTLLRSVVRPLRGLVPDMDDAKIMVEQVLEAIVAHGDVVEQHELTDDQPASLRLLLYAAPLSFVARQSGGVVLLGVSTDQRSPLPEELAMRIEFAGHVRRIKPNANEDLRSELRQLGLTELSFEAWQKAPSLESAADHLASVDRALDAAPPSLEVPGLDVLDPVQPVRYYRGRWTQPKKHSGRFVGRRSQAYGADLWCYVQLKEGNPLCMIDLPHSNYRWRGCDAAWRLQIAIDAVRGAPQLFRVRSGPHDDAVIELFSPVPAWVRRRWDAIGEPVPRSGCLFAYVVPRQEIDEERRFARDVLWMQELN
jgi:hypothetical protein